MKDKWLKLTAFAMAFSSLTLLCSCATTSESAKKASKNAGGEGTSSSVGSVSLPVSVDRSYFGSIDKDILLLVYEGSPESLRSAYARLHRSDITTYTASEAVLINIISDVSSLVWPNEKITMEVPALKVSNPYTGAVDSAKKGIFDTSTGNADFLAVVLPSLVLVTGDVKADVLDDCAQSLSQALKIKADSTLALYLKGLLCLKQSDYTSAIDCFSHVKNLQKGIAEVDSALIKAYFGNGNYSRALSMAEALLQSDNQNIDLLKICARASYAAGDNENAENYVLRVLQLDPSDLEFVLFRAEILIAKGDYVRASSLLDVYGRTYPNGRKYLLLRAEMQKSWNKNNTTAAETITKAVNLYPDDREILLFAAQFASETDVNINGKSALDYANKVLDKDSSDLKALNVCADEFIKKGDWLSAYSICQPLIKRSDVTSSIIYDYINVCVHLNKSSEAWNLVSDLYAKSPDDETVQQMYIQVLIMSKRTKEALTLINALLPGANSKMKSFLYYEKSLIDGDEEAVLADLRSSLTANPRNVDVLYRMYQIYYGRSDWKRAQYYLKQVVALEPKNQEMVTKNQELDALLGK